MVKLDPLPDYGSLMVLEEFRQTVETGGFIDYDGFGYYATKDGMDSEFDNMIYPSEFISGKKPPPEWATHMIWFNR